MKEPSIYIIREPSVYCKGSHNAVNSLIIITSQTLTRLRGQQPRLSLEATSFKGKKNKCSGFECRRSEIGTDMSDLNLKFVVKCETDCAFKNVMGRVPGLMN